MCANINGVLIDNMATQTISTLPPELTEALFKLGNRKLVLVEGEDDLNVFEEWFGEDLSDIFFYPAVGSLNVETFIEKILAISSKNQVYGIIDRDFRTEQDVNTSLTDETTHLFILRRYALENYLLEPFAVWEELRVYHDKSFKIKDSTAMEAGLLDICKKLKTIMAANWVIYESATGAKYFPEGYDISSERMDIIRQTAQRLNYDIDQTEEKIIEKETIIQAALSNINEAYQVINGKHIYHHAYQRYVVEEKRGLRKDHFRNLLARTVKEKVGLHADILLIIKQRILSKT
jgi:hypothetical protein